MKRSSLIKSILEIPWVHCDGCYDANTCSYGSFIKDVTFMRAFCSLIVKSRESNVYKKRNSEQLMAVKYSDLFKDILGVILKKWLVQLMCSVQGSIFVQTLEITNGNEK